MRIPQGRQAVASGLVVSGMLGAMAGAGAFGLDRIPIVSSLLHRSQPAPAPAASSSTSDQPTPEPTQPVATGTDWGD